MMIYPESSVRTTVLLLLTLIGAPARAFFDPPWITPETPTSNDAISVHIRGGICDGVIEWPGYPVITQNENSIRLVEYGVHETFADFCIYPTGTLIEPIGNFPPGDYTLTVDFTYDNYPFGYDTITLGVVPFSVTGSAPAAAPVPSSTRSGLALLLLVLCALAARSLWRSRRGYLRRAIVNPPPASACTPRSAASAPAQAPARSG